MQVIIEKVKTLKGLVLVRQYKFLNLGVSCRTLKAKYLLHKDLALLVRYA